MVSKASIAETSDTSLSIYFHSSEINIHRNSILKQKMDSFLVKNGNYQFQPVINPEDFASLLTQSKSDLFMMPSWQFNALSKDVSLTAHLVGIKNQSAFFRKSFVISKGAKTRPRNQLIIAASGSNTYIRKLMQDMALTTPELKNNLLQVPKDLDALLSVGFGMAQAAISTQDSLTQLKHLYKNQYDQLDIIATSQPLLRLLLVSHKGTSDEQRHLVNLIEGMDQTLSGKLPLSLIGLDSWMRYSKAKRLSNEKDIKPVHGSQVNTGGQQP
jgi:hypothetical protein